MSTLMRCTKIATNLSISFFGKYLIFTT